MRSITNKGLAISYIVIVILPLLLIIGYLCFFAQERFVSQSTLLVKQVGEVSDVSASSGLSTLLGVSNTSSEDAHILTAYINSRNMVEQLDKKLSLRKAFIAHNDPVFGLNSDASVEDLVKYFNQRVKVDLDEKTMMMTISSQGFTPNFALLLNQEILKSSETFINGLSQQIAEEQLKFAENQLNDSKKQLADARDTLLEYQNNNQMYDPQAQAQAIATLVAGLESNLAQLRTEERTLLSYLNPEAPQVVAIRSQIESVQKQVNDEKAKLTSPNTSKLNKSVADFEALKANVEFSTDLYKLSLASLEKARLEASRKLKKLVVISTPELAQDALYPRTLYLIATYFLVLNILFGIAMLIYSIIREHKE
ncbi:MULTISPECIES: capsule biosynthesis protein [Acinetobacter]|uniref:Capsule biosynthesis protein n=1 Tax=Acinetobacter corruptisaponis TaxID=3045147 RepID=A0ABY8S0Z1_9GAMM|nr:capsule biosynthesis protein [Acinetobacter sp. KCTC 92772]WHP04467.1 capsule biosynthesis protein [Acinetobacter sp. KCTC 92772]